MTFAQPPPHPLFKTLPRPIGSQRPAIKATAGFQSFRKFGDDSPRDRFSNLAPAVINLRRLEDWYVGRMRGDTIKGAALERLIEIALDQSHILNTVKRGVELRKINRALRDVRGPNMLCRTRREQSRRRCPGADFQKILTGFEGGEFEKLL